MALWRATEARAIARLRTLDVPTGDAAVLSGASGAGKTTLLLAIAGLTDVVAGSVRIAGAELADAAPRAARSPSWPGTSG